MGDSKARWRSKQFPAGFLVKDAGDVTVLIERTR